jgi:hypothetical protein
MNAVKHGMTARLPVLSGEDLQTFQQHVEGIVDSLEPRNALELALAEQAALSFWKIERAERVEAARVNASLQAARAHAEARRQEELHALGRWLVARSVKDKRERAEDLLAFLPEDRHAPYKAGRGEPLVVLLRIQGTADGCAWLVDRWIALGAKLEQEGDWDLEELIEAVQLRGERPMYLETGEWEYLLQERQVKNNPALVQEGRLLLLDQLTDGREADPAGPAMALRRLVEEEVTRLEEMEKAHRRREATERSELADRLALDTTPEGERLRRHANDSDRKLHRALADLLKLRREEGLAADPDVAGEPEPVVSDEPSNGPVPAATNVPVTVPIAPAMVEPPDRPATTATDIPVATSEQVEQGRAPTPTATDPPAIATATAGAIEPANGGAGAPRVAWGPPDPPAAESEPGRPNRPAPHTGGEPIAQNEPGPFDFRPLGGRSVAAGEPMAQNEPGPAAGGDEPTPHPVGELIAQNEPGPAVGGDENPANDPGGPGCIAARGVPALASALVLLLAVCLSRAFAAPIGPPIPLKADPPRPRSQSQGGNRYRFSFRFDSVRCDGQCGTTSHLTFGSRSKYRPGGPGSVPELLSPHPTWL